MISLPDPSADADGTDLIQSADSFPKTAAGWRFDPHAIAGFERPTSF